MQFGCGKDGYADPTCRWCKLKAHWLCVMFGWGWADDPIIGFFEEKPEYIHRTGYGAN